MNDSNSGRLIFPIKDHNGQVVGFSARRMVEDDTAKYINSPETKVFTKSNILYNYNLAKQTAKHDGFIYVVEGFMDVFALDSIGITSCVALMSTKLTTRHIEMLKSLGVEIRLCLDGDKPGQEAMMKIMRQLNEANLPYRLVSVPLEVRDPDEILKQDGKERLQVFVNSLVDPFNFALNYYKNISPLETIEDKKKVINHFLPAVSKLETQLERDDYIYKLSDATGFSASAIKNLVKDYETKRKQIKDSPTYNVNSDMSSTFDNTKFDKDYRRLALAEYTVLQQMFLSKEAISFYEQNIKYFNDEKYRSIANFLMEQNAQGKPIDQNEIINIIQLSELKDGEALVNIISNLAFSKNNTYSENVLNDCYRVIVEERSKLHDKYTLKKALEGKSPQEQARIVNDFMTRKKI